MRTLSRVQAFVNGSALLRTALRDGSVQIIYRQPQTSSDRLTVTWRLSVLVLDLALIDVVQGALERLGFEVQRDGEMLQAGRDFLLSAADREELQAQEQAQQTAAKEEQQQAQQQATATTISDLQEQLQALRDEIELLRLLPGKPGRKGAKGDPGEPGTPGRDGQDMLASEAVLGDLQDVSDLPAEQGEVLTWDAGIWTPKPARVALASIGGGGGGGMAGLTVGTYDLNGNADVSTQVTALRFDSAAGFTVVEGPDGVTEARVTMNSTFKTWKVDGQADVVAEGEDTMHVIAGPGLAITTSPTEPKSLTFSLTGQSIQDWAQTTPGHLVPADDNAQDLGDGLHHVRSIYLGGNVLAVNQDGQLTWGGQVIALANPDSALADGGDVLETGTPDPILGPYVPGLEADGGVIS